MAWDPFDFAKFNFIRFAIIKYTSKLDEKISVTDRMTEWQNDRLIDWLTDWLTDICIPRAAFAAEKIIEKTLG